MCHDRSLERESAREREREIEKETASEIIIIKLMYKDILGADDVQLQQS